jgi:hypothetical protein
MKIVLTPQESENYFFNALCNGLGYVQQYGLDLQCDEQEYEDAKLKLQALKPDERICYEDVFMQILRDGGKLNLKDEEYQIENEDNYITLEDVHERVANTPTRHLFDMINGKDDADTADVMLQQVFLGEVIFG